MKGSFVIYQALSMILICVFVIALFSIVIPDLVTISKTMIMRSSTQSRESNLQYLHTLQSSRNSLKDRYSANTDDSSDSTQATVLKTFVALAEVNNVRIVSLERLAEKKEKEKTEFPFVLHCKGTYNDLGFMIQDIESRLKFIRISKVSIISENDQSTLVCTIYLSIYSVKNAAKAIALNYYNDLIIDWDMIHESV